MKQCYEAIKENSNSLKDVHTLVGVSLFFALNVILNMVATVQITPELKVGFASIATAASCFFYGPVPNLIVAPLLDFVNYCVKPSGSYMPLYMISAMAAAIIFSAVFYKQEINIKRVIVARLGYDIIVSLLLNTVFTAILYDLPFLSIAAPKLIKNLIGLPIQVAVLYLTMKACTQIKSHMNL